MAGNTDNPRIWLTADAWTAPEGATLPTNVVSSWESFDIEWEALGLLSEDGLTESRSEDVVDHHAWGGILVRTTRSKHKRSFKVMALEDNDVVFGLVNPGSHTVTGGGVTTRTIEVPQSYVRAFGFELRDGDITSRIVIPRGEVTEVGDVVRSETGMTMRELTISVYAATDLTLYKELTNDTQAQGTILS
jgi:hypothetical protein